MWQQIGGSFDATRQAPWPRVAQWLRGLPPDRRIADVMAGNGRHAAVASDLGHPVLCIDWSSALCRAAAARGLPVVQADAARLPLRDASFDAVLCIAGLHGLPTEGGRSAALQEMRRVLGSGGPALVTVWSRHAARFAGLAGDGSVDVVVPWRRDGLDVERHYHLYTVKTLRAALEAAGFDVDACRQEAVTGAGQPDNIVAEVRG